MQTVTPQPPLYQLDLAKRIADRKQIADAQLEGKGPFDKFRGKLGLAAANFTDRVGSFWYDDPRAGVSGFFYGAVKGAIAAMIALTIASTLWPAMGAWGLATIMTGTWGFFAVGETLNNVDKVRAEGGPRQAAEAADMLAERAGALPPNLEKQMEAELQKPQPEENAEPAPASKTSFTDAVTAERNLPPDYNLFMKQALHWNRELEAQGKMNFTLQKLMENPERLSTISSHLYRQGIRQYPDQLMGGNMALAMDISDNAVLRVVDAKAESPRRKDWKIIQPVADLGEVAETRMEILPKVVTLKEAIDSNSVTQAQALDMTKNLVAAFAQENRFFWDCRPENIAVVKHGSSLVPLLLDSGAEVPMSQMHGGKIGNDTNTNLDKFAGSLAVLSEKAGKPDPAIRQNPQAYLAKLRDTHGQRYNFQAAQQAIGQAYAPPAKAIQSPAETKPIAAVMQR